MRLQINNKIVVWHNQKNDSYYYKIVRGIIQRYYVGFKNQYGHKIVLIIECDFMIKKEKLKKKLIKRIISFLEKYE